MSLTRVSLEHVYCINLVSNHILIRFIRFVSRFTVHFCNAIYFSTIFSTLCKWFTKILCFGCKDLNTAIISTKRNVEKAMLLAFQKKKAMLLVQSTSCSGEGARNICALPAKFCTLYCNKLIIIPPTLLLQVHFRGEYSVLLERSTLSLTKLLLFFYVLRGD